MRSLIFIILLFINFLQADVILEQKVDKYDNFTLQYFHDINQSLDINSIKNFRFKNTIKNRFTFGYIDGDVWFKLKVKNNTKKNKFILNFNEPFYEHFTLYKPQKNSFKAIDSGIATPIEEREVYASSPTFILNILPNEIKTYYIKTYSKFAHVGEVKIHDYDKYFTYTNPLVIGLYMFYFGSLLMIILLNVFLAIRLREILYAYYVGYVSSFAIFIFIFSGIDFYTPLGLYHYELHFAVSFIMFFLILFTIEFLNIKRYMPKLNKILLLLSFLFLILAVLIAIDVKPWYMLMNNLTSLAFALLIYSAIYILKQNNENAKYFLIIMIPTVITLALLSNLFTGVLANNDFNRYSFLVASFLEISFFALILANRFSQTKELANKDALTKLYNRNYFKEVTPSYYDNSVRHGHKLSVLMIDIDSFKKVNDTYGHAVGDEVLVNIAKYLNNFSRKGDTVIRFGGEEFLFLIYDSPLESSVILANRICQYVEMSKITTIKNKDIFVTLSIGVAQLDTKEDSSIEDIIKRADNALYKAKENGKNRVEY